MAYMNTQYDYPPEWDEPEEDEVDVDDFNEPDDGWVEDPHSESLWEQRK